MTETGRDILDLSSATVAIALLDEIRGEDETQTAAGFLLDSVTTVNLSPDPDGALDSSDQPIKVLISGIVDESELPTIDDAQITSCGASTAVEFIFR